jgi:SAM-dependent methyltransferase
MPPFKQWITRRWADKRVGDPAAALEQKRRRVRSLVNEIVATRSFEQVPHSPLAAIRADSSASGSTVIAMEDRYGFPVRLAMCHETGLLFLMDRLTPAEYGEFYRDGTYRRLVAQYKAMALESRAIIDEQEKQAAANAEVVARAVTGLLRLQKNARVLDVGGSTGALARLLRDRYDAQVTVVDPAEAELRVARAGGLDTIAGTIEDADIPEGRRFDLVIINQAMEHIIDVRAAFARVHDLLAPDGCLVFDILDFISLTDLVGSPAIASRLDHCHFYYDEMIDAFTRRLGFNVRDRILHQPGCVLYVCVKGRPQPDASLSPDVQRDLRRRLLSQQVAWKLQVQTARESFEERTGRRLTRFARSVRAGAIGRK